MEKNLTFNESLTVEQFKTKMQVETIHVKKNPQTGKLFMVYGAAVGAVALKGIPTKPMISNVTTPEGDNFWLLHEEGEGLADVASF